MLTNSSERSLICFLTLNFIQALDMENKPNSLCYML